MLLNAILLSITFNDFSFYLYVMLPPPSQNSALHLAYLYGATSAVHLLERAKCEQILNINGAFPMDIIGEFASFPAIITPLLSESK